MASGRPGPAASGPRSSSTTARPSPSTRRTSSAAITDPAGGDPRRVLGDDAGESAHRRRGHPGDRLHRLAWTAELRRGTHPRVCCPPSGPQTLGRRRRFSRDELDRGGRGEHALRRRRRGSHRLPHDGGRGHSGDRLDRGGGGRRRCLPAAHRRSGHHGDGRRLRGRAVPALPGRRGRPGEPAVADHVPQREPLRDHRSSWCRPGAATRLAAGRERRSLRVGTTTVPTGCRRSRPSTRSVGTGSSSRPSPCACVDGVDVSVEVATDWLHRPSRVPLYVGAGIAAGLVARAGARPPTPGRLGTAGGRRRRGRHRLVGVRLVALRDRTAVGAVAARR